MKLNCPRSNSDWQTLPVVFYVALLFCCESLISDRVYAQGIDIDQEVQQRLMAGLAAAKESLQETSWRAAYTISSIDYPMASGSESTGSKRKAYPIQSRRYVIHGSKYVNEVVEDEGVEVCSVKNPHYAFSLTKDTRDDSYSLSWLAQCGASPEEDKVVGEKIDNLNAIALGTVHLYGRFVWSFVEELGFEMKTLSALSTDDGERIRVEFDYTPDISETNVDKKVAIENGYFVCDPNNKFSLCEFGRVVDRGGDKTLIDCDTPVGGALPLARTMMTTFRDRTGKPVYERQVVCIESTFDDITVSEFYLPHYGLPEPNFNRPWIGTWVWYLLAGVICLGVSRVILRRRAATV